MKVLILSDVGFKPGGGTETYCRIVRDINVRAGNEVLMVDISKIDPAPALVRTFWDRTLEEYLASLINKVKVDIVHANVLNPRCAYILSKLLSKLNVPLVFTCHTWIVLCPIEWKIKLPHLKPCIDSPSKISCFKCGISKAKLVNKQLSVYQITRPLWDAFYTTQAFKKLMQKASAIISPSKALQVELQKFFGAKIFYAPNPVDYTLLKMKPVFEGDGSVLFIGRLTWEKGVHLLPLLAKLLKDTTIHVVGHGPLLSWLLKHSPKNVVFHGFLIGAEKIELMAKASAVIVPSMCYENLPYVTIEAFSLGKPVVAFDLGGPKELIEMSRGGILAKPFDIIDFAEKVNYLLQNPSEARRRGLKGREFVEKYLNPNTYQKFLFKVYGYAINRT